MRVAIHSACSKEAHLILRRMEAENFMDTRIYSYVIHLSADK